MGSRVEKSLINAKVNLLFYFLSLFFSFFSRKIFLDSLGDNFIGLTGTLGSILGYLNLAEFGISGAISIFLYKPLFQNDRSSIQEIISLLGYLYRKIGTFIAIVGIIISLFFPFIFSSSDVSLGIVYFVFYSFLSSSLIGYFINYREIILSADQKNYLVSIYYQSAGLIKTALQIWLAYRYKNMYAWVVIEFIFSVFACIILNWRINREYPWLVTNINQGKKLLEKYPEVLTKTKQIFIHKFKDFILTRSDELFIFVFVSLKMVAFYGNYLMIVNKLTLLFNSILDSTFAGVGNLVAEGNKNNTLKVFWELMAIRHFFAGFVCFSLYNLLEPFIYLWLGPEYILNHSILVLILIYTYIANSRGVVDMFNHSHGLYSDTWSAWVEVIINISITFIVGYFYGLFGILLGKIVSVIIIVIFWKPYYLFTAGFMLPISLYWRGTIKYYLINSFSFITAYWVINSLVKLTLFNFYNLIIYGFIIVVTYLLINIFLMYFFGNGTRSLIKRFIN